MGCPYHHCGITSSGSVTREGHCNCAECHNGGAAGVNWPTRIIRADVPDLPAGLPPRKPMCAAWYERAGNHRPWHARATGCMCGVSGQALPEQHSAHCPVYRYWNRRQWQGAEPGGAETWMP